MPTPFTGYSFHVVEALIVFANEVLVCFLFPIHMGLHRWYHMLTTTLIHMGTDAERGVCTAGGACGRHSKDRRERFIIANYPNQSTMSLCLLNLQPGGHAGYEMAPLIPSVEQLISFVVQGPKPSTALNTVRHHDLHHQIPTAHFSLYFTHWDRLCGTEHPSYGAYEAALATAAS